MSEYTLNSKLYHHFKNTPAPAWEFCARDAHQGGRFPCFMCHITPISQNIIMRCFSFLTPMKSVQFILSYTLNSIMQYPNYNV